MKIAVNDCKLKIIVEQNAQFKTFRGTSFVVELKTQTGKSDDMEVATRAGSGRPCTHARASAKIDTATDLQ